MDIRKIFLYLALLTLGLAGCEYNEEGSGLPSIPPPPEPAYVGSEACAGCHAQIHSTFSESGHPYKISKVVDGVAPTYPFTTLDYVPSGYTWDDISYVIGGYAWKARYIDTDGYILTGDDVQWNYQTEGAVPYHADEDPGTKKFTCGSCHTTGWKSVADGGSPQDDMPGMDGEFFAGGIQCEECHGMGSVHAYTKAKEDIIINSEAAECGRCHFRNADHTIAASGGFIKHHEQYDEMIAADHKELTCVVCHDPHVTVKHEQEGGIIKECLECHSDITKGAEHRGADCVTCHLPYASKSAVAINKYVGDIQTHIFKINPAADGKMFNEDGSLANGETGVTLDYVCYQCHKDEDGIGGEKSIKTMARLSEKATGYHEE